MLRNYIVTALRNLARNKLYAGISILGLAVAFAAAILIGQFVRNEFSYDRWLPGYQHVFRVTGLVKQTGRSPTLTELSPPPLKAQLKGLIPGASVTRLIEDGQYLRRRPGDEGILDETCAWVDADFFDVLPLSFRWAREPRRQSTTSGPDIAIGERAHEVPNRPAPVVRFRTRFGLDQRGAVGKSRSRCSSTAL